MGQYEVTIHFTNPDGTLEVKLEASNEDEACDKAVKLLAPCTDLSVFMIEANRYA